MSYANRDGPAEPAYSQTVQGVLCPFTYSKVSTGKTLSAYVIRVFSREMAEISNPGLGKYQNLSLSYSQILGRT